MYFLTFCSHVLNNPKTESFSDNLASRMSAQELAEKYSLEKIFTDSLYITTRKDIIYLEKMAVDFFRDVNMQEPNTSQTPYTLLRIHKYPIFTFNTTHLKYCNV